MNVDKLPDFVSKKVLHFLSSRSALNQCSKCGFLCGRESLVGPLSWLGEFLNEVYFIQELEFTDGGSLKGVYHSVIFAASREEIEEDQKHKAFLEKVKFDNGKLRILGPYSISECDGDFQRCFKDIARIARSPRISDLKSLVLEIHFSGPRFAPLRLRDWTWSTSCDDFFPWREGLTPLKHIQLEDEEKRYHDTQRIAKRALFLSFFAILWNILISIIKRLF